MSERTIPAAIAVGFEGVTPILRVRSLAASVDYYVQKLGFKIDWQAPFFASVSRGRCHIFLSEGDQGNPGGWVWIGVEDAGALFEEYRVNGAKIRHPPTNYDWAYGMQVKIRMETFCGWARIRNRISQSASGSNPGTAVEVRRWRVVAGELNRTEHCSNLSLLHPPQSQCKIRVCLWCTKQSDSMSLSRFPRHHL